MGKIHLFNEPKHDLALSVMCPKPRPDGSPCKDCRQHTEALASWAQLGPLLLPIVLALECSCHADDNGSEMVCIPCGARKTAQELGLAK